MAASSPPSVTVIGAGAVGICCALSLAQAGLQVQLIDQDEPGSGASHGNAGVISPWSIVPQSTPGLWRNVPRWLLDPQGPLAIDRRYAFRLAPWIVRFLRQGTLARVNAASDAMETLNQNNMELYRRHLAGTAHEHLIADSFYVHAFRHDRSSRINGLEYALRRDKGAEIEQIGGAELHDLEPALAADFKTAILIKGQARAVSPGGICKVLAQKFAAAGGVILREKVQGLKRTANGEWSIITGSGTLHTPKIVLSAGAWSARLLEPLGLRVPLEAERGYHVQFSNPGIALNNSVMDMDLKCVASSMAEGLRVAGTAEFAGLDAPPSPRRVKMLARAARRMLPDLQDEPMQSWMGIRPSLPDSLPVIGEVPENPGLFAAFGHCHYGLMMAPKTGEIVAGLVTGKPANIDLGPFRFDRF